MAIRRNRPIVCHLPLAPPIRPKAAVECVCVIDQRPAGTKKMALAEEEDGVRSRQTVGNDRHHRPRPAARTFEPRHPEDPNANLPRSKSHAASNWASMDCRCSHGVFRRCHGQQARQESVVRSTRAGSTQATRSRPTSLFCNLQPSGLASWCAWSTSGEDREDGKGEALPAEAASVVIT